MKDIQLFQNLVSENLGWVYSIQWEGLQHCHPALHQFFKVYLKNRPQHRAGPCSSVHFSFLAVQRDVGKGEHTGPASGKREIIRSWYMTDIRLALWLCRCILLGFQIHLAMTALSVHQRWPQQTQGTRQWPRPGTVVGHNLAYHHKLKLTVAGIDKSGWDPK